MELIAVLEGLLFVVGEEGISLDNLSKILEISVEETKNLVYELKKRYEENDRGLRVRFFKDIIKVSTKEEHKKYFAKLIENPETNTLSDSAMETLAIIAYNEPITRVEIDNIRGVSNAHMIRKLVAKGLIKEAGKSDMPGKPLLYRTTSEFLDCFGLSSLDELPKMDMEIIEDNEKELFTSIYKEDEQLID
ncbi:MAG: SMC-Scp complex subunit ScpB [Bacilli bacterium]|nr:SMC-Scp complex subunit ScpB [Bacilli bacterium]